MPENRTSILTSVQVEQIIQRIAHQILEKNYEEPEIVLVGIANKGFKIAKKIFTILSEISEGKVTLLELRLNKDIPLNNPIELSDSINSLAGKSVILIDDVLNSGRTLIYATRFLLEADIKYLSTVVLVDRKHRKFPIKANFVGLTLSTTLQEHISVEFSDEKVDVFLQ